MNVITNVMKSRRSIRKFEGVPTESQLTEIVEAGRWAPTGGNCQTIHFLAITNAEALAKLRTLVEAAFAAMEFSEDQYLSIQNSIKLSQVGGYVYDYNAPVLVVVANKKGYPNAMADSACALQNMMLAAESMDIGSCWINQLHWLDEEPSVKQYLLELGIAEDETICGAVALGKYGVKPAEKPREGNIVDWVR